MIASKYKLRPGILVLLCLFNCALLLHLGNSNWLFFKTATVILVMVCLQFVNYRLWWPTVVSIIACLIVFATRLPGLANHFNIEVITGIVILGCIACKFSGLKNRIAPAVLTLTMRCALISIYFVAGFHKLNSGFFNTDGSCAAYINLLLFGHDATLPTALNRTFQVATIVTEMVLPFGLLHHKLRKVTVYALILFHVYLALCGFTNFSAFAVFLLAGSVINLDETRIDALQKELRVYILCCVAAAL